MITAGNGYKLEGYKRADNVFGIRNHIIVLSTVCCANCYAQQIAEQVEGVVPILHQHGCNHLGDDRVQMVRTLAGMCSNPNVGGALIIGLGCETVGSEEISQKVRKHNRIIRRMTVQDIGNSKQIIRTGKQHLAEIKRHIDEQNLEGFDISNLVVGLECGASDAFSGISANPAVGAVCDILVQLGATVMLSETPEMIGAERALIKRASNKDVEGKILSKISRYTDMARESGGDFGCTNPTPGNIRAGITTIEEKSLGCITKSGTSKIREVVDYAEEPKGKGLVMMDTPGNDAESITGMVAGGAHLILLSTGLGTPLGHPIVPVIKISSNTTTFKHMRDSIDLDAGPVLDGANISEIGDEIIGFVVKVGQGTRTASERRNCHGVAINRIGPTF